MRCNISDDPSWLYDEDDSTNASPITPTNELSPYVSIAGQDLMLDGKPWRFIADNPWTLPERIGASPQKLANYLDTRKKQGFDCVIFWVMGSWFDKTVAKPLPQMFARSDAVMSELEKRGMYAIMCPALFQWVDSIQDNKVVLPISESYELGRIFGDRYKDRKNLAVYMAMTFDATTTPPLTSKDVMDLAKGIRAGDTNHVIMLGPKMYMTTTSYYPVGDCHQIAAYASYHRYTYDEIKGPMNEIASKGVPYANMEGPTYGEPGLDASKVTAYVNITKKWRVCGFVYLDAGIYPFKSGWEKNLDNAGVRAFLENVPKSNIHD